MPKTSTIQALEQLGYTKQDLDRQHREAVKRGEWSLKHEPRAETARYENGQIIVNLRSGWSFSFDPRQYKSLKHATDKELAEVKPLGFGFALEWESIDQHLGVGALILDLVGYTYLASKVGSRNGSVISNKKKAASRANGKLGGRPKRNVKKTVA